MRNFVGVLKEFLYKGKKVINTFMKDHIIQYEEDIVKARTISLTKKREDFEKGLTHLHGQYKEVYEDYQKEVQNISEVLIKSKNPEESLIDSQRFIRSRFERYEGQYLKNVRDLVQEIKTIDIHLKN